MFDLKQAITEWRQQMLTAGIQSPAPLNELEVHLRDEIQNLVRSGVPEEKAFQIAAHSLGTSKDLRTEFSKVNQTRFGFHRHNPLPLIILAASFFLMGIDPLLAVVRLEFRSRFQHEYFSADWLLIAIVTFWSFQIFIAAGLLRRSNVWRRITFAWSAFILGAIALSSLWAALHSSSVHEIPHGQTDLLLGIEVPYMIKFSLYLTHLTIMTAGFYILNRRDIRQLFRSDIKTKTA